MGDFILSMLVFMLFLLGLFFVSQMSLEELSSDFDVLMNPKVNIRKKADTVQKKKKDGFIRNLLRDTKTTLMSMGQSSKFIIICLISGIGSIVGMFLCSAVFGNPYLMPAFFIGFLSLPFVFVRTYSYSYQKHLRSELELTLSQISISYLRTDDIIKAVQENLSTMNSPVKEAFTEFLNQITYINANQHQAIDDLAGKIDNNVFREWCDCLKRCMVNRTLKYMLLPVVNKFSTLREISGSIQEAINGFRIEFYVIMGVVYMNYPLVYMMDSSWFDILINTTQGQIGTGLIALVSVICVIILSFILKPIDYTI